MKHVRLKLVSLAFLLLASFSTTSAFAAFGTASSSFFIGDVRTTGTAAVDFTGPDIFTALGTITDGTLDPASDGVLFDSEFSAFGDGTATNSFGSSSSEANVGFTFPETGTSLAAAITSAEYGLLVSGEGTIEIDLIFDLFVDSFENEGGFAVATFEAIGGDSGGSGEFFIDLLPAEVAGFGSSEFLTDVYTLSITAFGESFEDVFTVITSASTEVTAVPVPAAVWLFGSAIAGLFGFRRKTAA